MKQVLKVYALMFIIDVVLISVVSWIATIPLNSLITFAPLAALMFSIAAFVTYKLELRGVWWLLLSLVICDVFITLQFYVLGGGKMGLLSLFRELHQNRLTFFLTLFPEIVAHIVGAISFRFISPK